ncbi:MAG: VOC family protein [Candidatus Dormibacteraceae bacterium]
MIPNYTFGVELTTEPIVLSHEHTEHRWLSFEEATALLKWDDNRTALWELHERLTNGDIAWRTIFASRVKVVEVEGLDHVQISAPPECEDAARAFFGDLLALDELTKPQSLQGRGGAWFQCGGQQLHVGVEARHIAARKAHPALLVSSIASLKALAEKLEAAGYPALWDDTIPGTARFYTEDPWGNRLELIAVGAVP